jgi:beta-N-acetylhexosaminidase
VTVTRVVARLRPAFAVARLAVMVALIPLVLDWRSSLLTNLRGWALAGLLLVPAALIVVELRAWRADGRFARFVGAVTLTVAIVCLGTVLAVEGQFHWLRYQVLHADPAVLERLGRHVVVGYRDFAELEPLIERRAIAGVFVASRNTKDRDLADIRREIAAMQDIRKRQGLPPLWISADQEGGAVSRLSPPLVRLPPLAAVIAENAEAGPRIAAVRAYAATQGQGLADLGVNVNLAPVVDLNRGIVNPNDRYTRIRERALSDDPVIVGEAAAAYCAELLTYGVHCTLKHFPGLGRVFEDTHEEGAALTTSQEELTASDWLPFRVLMGSQRVFVMLAHARLAAIDPDHPVSFSPRVIEGLLRRDWSYDGVLITDDFGMRAVTGSPERTAGAGVAALNAGVDLILVSFDPDQFVYVMHALIAADSKGELRSDRLQASDRRLQRSRHP